MNTVLCEERSNPDPCMRTGLPRRLCSSQMTRAGGRVHANSGGCLRKHVASTSSPLPRSPSTATDAPAASLPRLPRLPFITINAPSTRLTHPLFESRRRLPSTQTQPFPRRHCEPAGEAIQVHAYAWIATSLMLLANDGGGRARSRE
jgi:hypothetical protein